MQVGLVGLGRMGGNMRERLRSAGHEVIGYDRDPGVSDTTGLTDLVNRLTPPRVVWLMVPVAVTEATVRELGALLADGDIVIDGGTTRYTDDAPRAAWLHERGIGYLDVGVSGGIWGREAG